MLVFAGLQKIFSSDIIVLAILKRVNVLLISAIIAGIENEYQRKFMENIYTKFYAEMKRRAFDVVENDSDAEEIVQESFIKLIKKVDTLMRIDQNKLPSYLFITTKNTAINFVKHKRYENKYMIISDEKDAAEWLPDEEGLPELILSHKEDLDILARALPLLPERDLRLLEAKYVLDLPSDEIAKQFNISPNSIRTYIMRARRKAYSLFLKEEEANV